MGILYGKGSTYEELVDFCSEVFLSLSLLLQNRVHHNFSINIKNSKSKIKLNSSQTYQKMMY
jgi:hypothetical protein